MNSFLCASSDVGTYIVYGLLILVLIAMLIMPYFSQRKRNKEFATMLESIKVGDLVKTAGGIIGKVTKITDKGEIKTVILETGSKNEKSYMEFDMTMIYCVLKSTKVDSVVIGDDEPAAENSLSEQEDLVQENLAVSSDETQGQDTSETVAAEQTASENVVVEQVASETVATETQETATEPKKKTTTKKPVAKKSTKAASTKSSSKTTTKKK